MNLSGSETEEDAGATRGTAVLNVTGNTFTGNNQVFAVEPGRALPGVTNLSGIESSFGFTFIATADPVIIPLPAAAGSDRRGRGP